MDEFERTNKQRKTIGGKKRRQTTPAERNKKKERLMVKTESLQKQTMGQPLISQGNSRRRPTEILCSALGDKKTV